MRRVIATPFPKPFSAESPRSRHPKRVGYRQGGKRQKPQGTPVGFIADGTPKHRCGKRGSARFAHENPRRRQIPQRKSGRASDSGGSQTDASRRNYPRKRTRRKRANGSNRKSAVEVIEKVHGIDNSKIQQTQSGDSGYACGFG